MRDGAVIHVAQGRDGRAADPSGVCRDRRQAGLGVHPLAGGDRAGRARHAGRKPRGRRRRIRSTPRSSSWSATSAHVDHIKITSGPSDLVHVSSLMAAIGANARFNDFAFNIGGGVVRNQLFVRFDGEGTLAGLRGASLLKGKQHVDTTLVVDHKAGGCQSREVFATVLDDESRGVFQGKIIVRPHAQKTDAKMMTRALLLSDEAEADNKPELEIFADDVQCGHGATSGALDEDLKFYLMARGIPRGRGRGAAGAGVRRRGDRGHRARRPARRADGARRGLARGARGADAMHPAVTNGSLRRRPHPRGFPDPRHAGLRQAAGLSRQRGLGAEAQGGARPHPAGLHVGIRQRASRAALPRQRRDRGLRGRAREGAGVPQRGAARRDHLHPQRHRGDQPRRLYVRARAHQAGRRDRALDHGAPFQHRAVAFPARAPGRGDQMGAGRRGGQLPHRRVREAADAAHQDGGDHPHVEHARHRGAGEGRGASSRKARGIPVLVDGSQARGASRRATCRTSAAISTSSPATSSTARPASACCRASTTCSPRCRRSTAAAR